MVEKRKQQKTRYQGVAFVAQGNLCRGLVPLGSGLCVPATTNLIIAMQDTDKKPAQDTVQKKNQHQFGV